MNYKILPHRKILTTPVSTMDSEQLSEYLFTFTSDDIQQSKQMWKRYASRKDILDFHRDNYVLEDLKYYRVINTSSSRYLRSIPYLSIKNETIRFSNGVKKEQRLITQQFLNETLPSQDWYQQTLSLAKLSLLAIFMLAEGGYTFDNLNSLDNWILFTLPVFSGFNNKVEELNTGKRALNGRVLSVTDMFSDELVTEFENIRLNWAVEHGLRRARRRLYGGESCHDSGDRKGCVELSLRGYEPVWKIVPIGRAACWGKCRCYIEYAEVKGEQ